jgi:hypothetical protein
MDSLTTCDLTSQARLVIVQLATTQVLPYNET